MSRNYSDEWEAPFSVQKNAPDRGPGRRGDRLMRKGRTGYSLPVPVPAWKLSATAATDGSMSAS